MFVVRLRNRSAGATHELILNLYSGPKVRRGFRCR